MAIYDLIDSLTSLRPSLNNCGHWAGQTERSEIFSSVELIGLLADLEWLDEVTKTIGQFWKRKNATRNGLTLE